MEHLRKRTSAEDAAVAADVARLCDLEAPVVYFPVRHHSPASARILRELARRLEPSALLIEGPAPFNEKLSQLHLPHELPIAIYLYSAEPLESDGEAPLRRGVYYPLFDHSPEWQALIFARDRGLPARFIDLPWHLHDEAEAPDLPDLSLITDRYVDGELGQTPYVKELCSRLGVDDFDALWDTLFEIDGDLTVEEYLIRCHQICLYERLLSGESPDDRPREAYMAHQIAAARRRHASGQLLVVTGGWHSAALAALVEAGDGEPPGEAEGEPTHRLEMTLTPYSYPRLDSQLGYRAGLPSPGFYQRAWQLRSRGETVCSELLLVDVARTLRERGQVASTADLIAVATTARGLSALRGHAEVWRDDLLDAIAAALIKEEQHDDDHPLMSAVKELFRGSDRGALAEGTALPSLVDDLRQRLAQLELSLEVRSTGLQLELSRPHDLQRSRTLHQCRLLGVAGIERAEGSDLFDPGDRCWIWERWELVWSPEHEASVIESAIYGATLPEAAAARLLYRAERLERDALEAAALLLDGALIGVDLLPAALFASLARTVRAAGDLLDVSGALERLVFLFHYDEVLGGRSALPVGDLVRDLFWRGLWLLEGLGQSSETTHRLAGAVRQLVDTYHRCGAPLTLDGEAAFGTLARVAADRSQVPAVRGAAMGALWAADRSDGEQVISSLNGLSSPSDLGDFLAGLFSLAREQVQREPSLVLELDGHVLGLDEEAFLTALPSLRMAFTYFTPREKRHLATTLLEATGVADQPLADLVVPAEQAAEALAFESALFAMVERYGLRGCDDG